VYDKKYRNYNLTFLGAIIKLFKHTMRYQYILFLSYRYGLGSLLEVVCRICSGMKLVSTGKRNEKGGFDINSKVALGMFKKLAENVDTRRMIKFISTSFLENNSKCVLCVT
jgi:hypothetical protein